MSINIYKDQMQYAELFGKPVLHTVETIPRETVPEGWHCYELSGNTRQPERAAQLVNRATAWLRIGSVLSPAPLKRDTTSARQIKKDQFSLSDRTLDLAGFCQEQGLPCPHDPRKYVLRPASKEEAGLFYSQMEPEQDTAEGTVGHLRMDFGGGRFHHSWWPHNDDRFNTPEFKAVLQELVDELRDRGPLKSQSAMSRWCYQHTGSEIQNGHYGFIAETTDHRFCLRCTTMQGDYSYLYCYDLSQQRLAIETKQAQKQQEQSRFGLTEAGLQKLQNAADPNLYHTYEWYVIENIRSGADRIDRPLPLEEAITLYAGLDSADKRLGVTKDSIVAVDLVIRLDDREWFPEDWKKSASFAEDPVVAEALRQMHQALDKPEQGMTMGGMSL